MHHPKADVNRLPNKSRNGGRGLVELKSAYYGVAVVCLIAYIKQGIYRFTR